MPQFQPSGGVTIILPTRNRAALCIAQLRFLQSCGVRHPIVVADSSDVVNDDLQKSCRGLVDYRRFPPTISPGTKLEAVATSVSTPFVAMLTDDDISFPHTINAGLSYLQQHPDYVAAQGYVLKFAHSKPNFDIHAVQWFIPSIAETNPIRRLYELMRRYQPFFWAVFRTDAYRQAIRATNEVKGAIFQELTFTATITMLGKSVRLPMIQTLRGEEDSHTPLAEGHPFYWFLKDAPSFFTEYIRYRKVLVGRLRALSTDAGLNQQSTLGNILRGFTQSSQDKDPTPVPNEDRYDHAVDIIHASYFGREIDMGLINHTARILVGDPLKPIVPPQVTFREHAIAKGDVVHPAKVAGRNYIWRSAVVNAEPHSEITISTDEIARAEATLDHYILE